MLNSEAWHRAEPSFSDEFVGSFRTNRLPGEWTAPSSRRTFTPPFDVYETDGDIVIKVEIAGMQEDDFAISVDGHVLHIGGARADAAGKIAYERMEINYGEFRLDIGLPVEVDADGIEARYDRGFLSVRVPRRPRQMRVPIAGASGH